MPDAFLEAHRTPEPCIYDLGGKLSPFSIRDQLLRAQLFVERAWSQGLISQKKPLLVIGGNVTGVAVMTYATTLGVPVTLCEREQDVMTLFAGCVHRWIDPTVYDWPHPHWDNGHYPIHQGWVPMSWSANTADQVLALDFLSLYNNWELTTAAGRSTRLLGWTVAKIDPAANGLRTVHFKKPQPVQTATGSFPTILLCAGPGMETTWHDPNSPFAAPPFWVQDDLTAHKLGLVNLPAGPKKVLICGGGDGGLQDFLRLLTRDSSPHQMLRTLDPLIGTEHLLALEKAQSQVNRLTLWGPEPTISDHRALTTVQQEFQSVVDTIWSPMVESAVSACLVKQAQRPIVTLIHGCEHFGNVYAANRFLVLLVAKYLGINKVLRNGGLDPIKSHLTIADIISADGHHCSRCQITPSTPPALPQLTPSPCWSHFHKVSLAHCPDCWTRNTNPPSIGVPEVWHKLSIRFGPTGLLGMPFGPGLVGIPSLPRRHVLPFYPL